METRNTLHHSMTTFTSPVTSGGPASVDIPAVVYESNQILVLGNMSGSLTSHAVPRPVDPEKTSENEEVSTIEATDENHQKQDIASLQSQKNRKNLKYKLTFTVSVVGVLTTSYALILFPWLLPYTHTVLFPVLVALRLYTYWSKHWQLFCLDFCYFANAALILYCWCYPQSETLFAILFGAANGPLAVAIILWRNSLVYHDYDRMISIYIHIMPALITYVIRWSPAETERFWPSHTKPFIADSMYTNNTASAVNYLPSWVAPSWLWVVTVPLAWFTLHTILYTILEKYLFYHEKYVTSFRWLTSDSKSLTYRIITFCGKLERYSQFLWVWFNVMYTIVSVLIARLVFQYQTAHIIYLCLVTLTAIYNGASYYIDKVPTRGL